MATQVSDGLQAAMVTLALLGPICWVIVTRMKIRAGYALTDAFGRQVRPGGDEDANERVRLLSTENAQLRAEIGSIKDRLANVERIVTDEAHQLTREIETLRIKAN